jgi:hypothetical protein
MPFRILAGLIGAGYLVAAVLDPDGIIAVISDDLVSLAAFFTVLPLFIYVTFTGKLPDALVKRLPDSLYEDLARAETLFTRFDVRSVVAALVVLILGCYAIMNGPS